jgi:hypothetical protein
MNRTTLSLLVALGVLGAGAGVAALSQKSKSPMSAPSATVGAQETVAVAAQSPIDLGGHWRLDRDHSDGLREGRRGTGMGRSREGRGGVRSKDQPTDGAWRERRRADRALGETGGRGRGGMRRFRFPELIRIEQAEGRVRIADSSGAMLQEVAIGDAPAPNDEVQRVIGRWNDQRLEIQRPGRPGMSFRESWELEDGGQSLVIRTRIGRDDGSAPAREMKRVYRRVSES